MVLSLIRRRFENGFSHFFKNKILSTRNILTVYVCVCTRMRMCVLPLFLLEWETPWSKEVCRGKGVLPRPEPPVQGGHYFQWDYCPMTIINWENAQIVMPRGKSNRGHTSSEVLFSQMTIVFLWLNYHNWPFVN